MGILFDNIIEQKCTWGSVDIEPIFFCKLSDFVGELE